jgi:parvulin-like peptidyl-prolyl isomerase
VYDAGGKPIDPEKVVIRVGGEKLTADEVDAFISNLPPDQQAMLRSEGRRGLADYLVKTELLAREAKSRKLDQDPRVRRQMRLVQDQLLARAMVGDLREGVDDASVRKFFEEHRDVFERVHARHILVRAPGSRLPPRPGQKELTEEQSRARATDIYNRVKAGADFAKVAREESDDVGSGADGGDMGSIRRGAKVEAFEKAVFALKEGEIGPPVRSPMGWHVIQVLERFDRPEKLAEQIRAILGPQKTQELIQGLEKEQKVEVDDTFFGPANPPEPATGGASQPARPPAPR